MNIIFNIGIYMLASSVTMIGYVWFKYVLHTRSNYDELSQVNDYEHTNTRSSGEVLAA